MGSILRFDTEFNIGIPDDNCVTKYVCTCAFKQELFNMQLKEWSRSLNEDLLYCNWKHLRKGKTQLDRSEGDSDGLKRDIQSIREINEFLNNKIDHLTSIL